MRIAPNNTRAILSGNNADNPVLRFLPKNTVIEEGAEVVTSGDGGQVPIGIPVGVVRVDDDGRPFVDLQEDLHNLSYVELFRPATLNNAARNKCPNLAGRGPMSGQSPTGVQTPGQRVWSMCCHCF